MTNQTIGTYVIITRAKLGSGEGFSPPAMLEPYVHSSLYANSEAIKAAVTFMRENPAIEMVGVRHETRIFSVTRRAACPADEEKFMFDFEKEYFNAE